MILSLLEVPALKVAAWIKASVVALVPVPLLFFILVLSAWVYLLSWFCSVAPEQEMVPNPTWPGSPSKWDPNLTSAAGLKTARAAGGSVPSR